MKPIYLLYGEEPYLIDEFVKKFINRFVDSDPDVRDFMLSQINEEDEENFDEKLAEICQTVSMFAPAPYRVVIANCDERLKSKGSRTLLKLVDNFPVDTVLLLRSKEKPDQKLELVEKIKSKGQMIQFKSLKYKDLDKWIAAQFKFENKKVVKKGINFLENHFHNNLQRLKSEIEKIVTYVGDKDFISMDDIKAVISKDTILKENIIFDLTDAVGQRNIKKALLILDEMERQGEPLFLILKMFIRQLRLIIFSKEMKAKGFPPDDAAKRLNQHPYPIKKCYNQARNFTMAELEMALERMLQVNHDIVTGKYPDKLALQLALIDFEEQKSVDKTTPKHII